MKRRWMFEVKSASLGGSSRWMLKIKNRCAESRRSSRNKISKKNGILLYWREEEKGIKNALAPILFTKESVVCIRLLLKHKTIMGIDPTNKYSFENSDLSTAGWDTL